MVKPKLKKGSGVEFGQIEQIATAELIAEQWKPIPLASGYEASSCGRVRSQDRRLPDGRMCKGKVLRSWIAGAGYEYVNLGKCIKGGVHRFVAMAFHGMPTDDKIEAAHLDGTKTNNAATNLMWATRSENEQQKRAHGTYARPRVFGAPGQKKRGPLRSRHLLADEIVNDHKEGMSLSCLARKYGMSKSGMWGVLKRRV